MESNRARAVRHPMLCGRSTSLGPSEGVNVAMLMTDVIGSTRLWEAEAAAMAEALRRHDAIVGCAVRLNRGAVIKQHCGGDGTFAVFSAPRDAIAAAVTLQRECLRTAWPTVRPLLLRAAVHHGTVEHRQGDYFGLEVNRCARLCGVGEPGAVLLSLAAAIGLGTTDDLIDRGDLALRDVAEPVHAFEIDVRRQAGVG